MIKIRAQTNNPNIIKGKNNQKIKNKPPKITTTKKNKIPTKMVRNLTLNPMLRETKLKEIYSKSFCKSKPRGRLVISLFQGANRVLKSKGIEKYSNEKIIKFFQPVKTSLTASP
jgi:hypothetical protein